jgi:HAE1 family hydrophobic/amphiphilic exporter-1
VGRLSDPKQFESIIVKNTANGIVQLRDVGRAEIGAESYDTNLMYSGHEAIGVGVQQLSNANALSVDKAAKAVLEDLSKAFPPGMKYVIAFDTTTVVGDSVKEVVTTLEEAILIVIIVIFFAVAFVFLFAILLYTKLPFGYGPAEPGSAEG